MKIIIEKKHLFGLLCAVLFVCMVFVSYKSCGKADYETTAKEMKINAMATVSIASQILSDYQMNWQKAINDKHAYNADGESQYCSDFNEALLWRKIYFTKTGYIGILDSLSNVVKEEMKILEDTPSKFEDTQKSFLAMYNDMNTLVSLVKEPKGSLLTFGQTVNELLMDVHNKYNETDLKISITDEEKIIKMSEIQNAVNKLIAAQDAEIKEVIELKKKDGVIFLSENAKKEGVVTLPSGLQYKILKEGKGVIPKDTSLVRVHYEGRLIDGTVFDSSYQRGKPAEMYANRVIKGFTEALTHMPAGSVWEVYIPQELAYGEREAGLIKPYSAIIFKIELLKVVK